MARRFRARIVLAMVVALVAGCLTACGEPSGLAEGDPAKPTTVRIITSGALEPVVTQLAHALESDRSDIDIDVVSVSADELHDRVLDANNDDQSDNDVDVIVGSASDVDVLRAEQVLAGDPLVFGSDMLVIVAPKGNPAQVDNLDAFGRDASPKTGVCEPTSYCGTLAELALSRAGVDADPDVVSPNAVALLLKVMGGEVDAGLLLRTQAASQLDAVSIVPIREEFNRVEQFSIAAVRASPVIDDVVDWLASSADAGRILSTYGLRDPPEEK